MPNVYPGYSFQPLTTGSTLPDATPRGLADVEASFRGLQTSGDLLAVQVNGLIKGQRYTYKNYGDGRANIHFQGIQRHRDGVHAFVTGGDCIEPAGHLFVLKLGSRAGTCGWGSNLLNGRGNPPVDVVARVMALDSEHWHAGGPALLGDLLAIPLEADTGLSRTVFFDVSDPEQPLYLPALDIVGAHNKGGAVALARLPDGLVLCAVYRDQPVGPPPRALDLHVLDPAAPAPAFTRVQDWPFTAGLPREGTSYEAVAFLHQMSADGQQSALYLIGSQNTCELAPVVLGQDVVDLYRVELDIDRSGVAPTLRTFELDYIGTRSLACNHDYANLAAIGGAHVDARGSLLYYAGYHWRVEDAIRLSEFRAPGPDATIASIDEAWIELYEHHQFLGRRLTLLGQQDASIPNYKNISVQGAGFNDCLSSIRYQLPPGATYRLYQDSDYPEAGAFIDLAGDGAVHEIPELRDPPWSFADTVSSSRYVVVV